MAPASLGAQGGASVRANAAKAEAYARKAKQLGADIVVMPEQWLVGYTATFPGFGHTIPANLPVEEVLAYTRQATALDGPVLSRFKTLAKQLDMAIAVSYLQHLPLTGGTQAGLGARPPQNAVALIDRFGSVAYNYAKVHTCYWAVDEAFTTAGDGYYAASISIRPGFNVTAGSFICYDRSFMESGRSLMLAGAELFLAPTACDVTEADHRLMAVRGRENAAGAVLVNYAPSNATPAAHINNAQGGSVAVDHVGNVVAVGSAT